MTYLRWAIALILVFGAPAASFAQQEEVLLLRSGRVIAGVVTRDGDRFVIDFADASRMSIPADAVQRRCASLEDAYQTKRETVTPANARQHLDLCEWCLRSGMLSQAANELLIAITIGGDNPQTQHYQQRLREAELRITGKRQVDGEIHETASADELEQMMRELPSEAVEQFTRSVQPVLLNHCSTSTCHGPTTTSEYRLLRSRSGHSVTRRFTQRNLHATLRLIDRENPDNSRLLTRLQGPHGTDGQPVFGNQQRDLYDRLVQWVRAISHKRPPQPLATIDETTSTLMQTDGLEMDEPSLREPAFAELRQPEPEEDTALRQDNFVPRDPFDPEIFNRRYFSRHDTESPATPRTQPPHPIDPLPIPSSRNSFRPQAARN